MFGNLQKKCQTLHSGNLSACSHVAGQVGNKLWRHADQCYILVATLVVNIKQCDGSNM